MGLADTLDACPSSTNSASSQRPTQATEVGSWQQDRQGDPQGYDRMSNAVAQFPG